MLIHFLCRWFFGAPSKCRTPYSHYGVSISLSNIVRFVEITMCVTAILFFSAATGPIYANFWRRKKVCRTLAEWLEGIPFYEWPRGSRANQRGFDRLALDTRYKYPLLLSISIHDKTIMHHTISPIFTSVL